MLAFRSEVHVDRWVRDAPCPARRVVGLGQAWQLGRAWYADKLSPDWKRATPTEAEAAFVSIGLTGEFWRLT